jgi:protein kinase A
MSDFSLKSIRNAEGGIDDHFDLYRTIALAKDGRTRLVRDRVTLKHYALKFVKKSVICDAGCIEQLKTSLFVLSRNRCTFAQNLQGFFQDDHYLYFLFDFVSGGGIVDRVLFYSLLIIDEM